MSDYDLQIDGKHFNFHWDRPQPPSKEDVETAVTQYRASMKAPAAAPKSAPTKSAAAPAPSQAATKTRTAGFIRDRAKELGITPQQARSVGVPQAVGNVNRAAMAKELARHDTGVEGGLRNLGLSVVESAPLAAAGGGAGAVLPHLAGKAVAGLFSAQMAKGAFDTYHNEKLRKSDPHKWLTLLLGQIGLAAAPGLPHLIKGAKALGETGARLKESAAFEGKTANTRRAVRPIEKATREPHPPRTGVVRPGKGKSAPAANEALEKAATPETAKRAPARVKRKGPAPFPEKRVKTAHVSPKEKESHALPIEKPGAGVLRQEGQGPGKGVELQRVGEGHQEPKKPAAAQESTPKEVKAAPRPQESAPADVPKALPSPPEVSAIADKEAASNAIPAEKMQPILATAHKAALDAGGFKGVRDVPIADAYKAATKAKLLPDKYTLKDFVRDAAAVGGQEGATHTLVPASTGAGVGVRTYGDEGYAYLRGPKPIPAAKETGLGRGTPKKGAQPGAISLSLKPRRQLREISNSVRNTLVEGASNFRELAAGKPSYHNATALAGAPSEANLHLRRYLPGIEKAFEGNKEDASRFYLYGQADRALTERFALKLERPLLQQKLTAAQAAGDTALARQVMGELKRVAHALNENIINRNELGTGTRPTVVDPVSKQPITGAMIEKYFAQPHVQNALKAYRPLEDLMRQNYTYDGSAANGDLGMHSNAFFPAQSLGENGLPTSGGGGTGGRTAPLMKLYSKPGRGHFSGTAHAYGENLEEGLQRRMASGLMARHAYEMASSLHQEGLMVSADDPTALRLNPTSHEIEININGEWEKASKPFNIQEKFSFAREYKDLPQRVVVPARLYNELRPLFDQTQGTYTSDVSNRLNSRLIGANLMGAGEAGSHGRGLTGRLAAAIPFLKGPAFIEGAQTGPLTLLNAMLHADNAFRGKWKFSDDERYAANLEAAQAGALPHEAVRWLHFKDAPTVAGKAAVPLRNILRSGGTLLYSDRGILANVHTAIYKYFKDSGQLASPNAAAARAQMHDMMRSMNVHNDFLRASATKGNTLGPLVGTYAQTGIRNRVAAYRGGVGPYLLRMAGTLALADALAVASDARHRHLWQIPGVKEGDFYFGEENGKTLSFNAIDFADRTQGYGDFAVRSVLQSLSTQDSSELKARKLVMAIANQSAQPFVSGPIGQAGQRFIGQTLYPSVDPRGQTTLLFSTKRSKEGILSQEHLKYTALALLPFLQFGESEQTAKTPTTQTVHLLGDKISLRAQLLNRALRLVGANQITVVDEAKALSRAQGQMHALSGEKRRRVRGVPDPMAQFNRTIRSATGGY